MAVVALPWICRSRSLTDLCPVQGWQEDDGSFCLRRMLVLTEGSLGTVTTLRAAAHLWGENTLLGTRTPGLEVSACSLHANQTQILTPEEGAAWGSTWDGHPLWISAQSSPPSPSGRPHPSPKSAIHFLLRGLGFL